MTALAGPDSVELTWSRSPEADLKAYKIYRAVGNGPLEPLGEPVNLPTFSDRKVERGKVYRYAISAVDQKNNESEKSTVVEVYVLDKTTASANLRKCKTGGLW